MSTRRRLAVSIAAAAAAASAVPLLVGSNASSAPAPAQCPSTPSFEYTIPTPVGPPSAISLSDGSAALAALGADRRTYYYEAALGGDPLDVSPLACLGGQATDAPAVVESQDGGRAFFVRAGNGTLYQRYVSAPYPSSSYSSIGSFTPVNNAASTNGPAAVQTPDGQYHLFVRGTNGALYHGFRQTTSPSSWRFENLGGQIVGSPVAIVDGSRILVAVVGTNKSIYTVRGTNFAWGPFTRIANQVVGNSPTQVLTNTPPALVQDPETGAVTMFAAHVDYGLFSITKPAGGAFSPTLRWVRQDFLLPSDARIAAATDGTSTIVFARFLDRPSGQVVLAYTQQVGTGTPFSDYFLAPYSCFNCAPDPGVPTTADRRAGGTATKEMPKTKVVLNK